VEIVLLMGAAPYPISEAETHRLEAIRRRCLDERGRSLDDNACACVQFADVLSEDLGAAPPWNRSSSRTLTTPDSWIRLRPVRGVTAALLLSVASRGLRQASFHGKGEGG
jgi:hypothetical protein